MSQSSKPIPLAIPNALLEQIDAAAKLTGRTRSELMRLAIEIGIADLRAINYDIAGTIVRAAKAPEPPGWLREPEAQYPSPAEPSVKKRVS